MLKWPDGMPIEGVDPGQKEAAMAHIVIHDGADGVTNHRQFDDLDAAVAHVEELRNRSGIEDVRLYELHEVVFELKQYFKVELGAGTAATGADEATDGPEPDSESAPNAEPQPAAEGPEIITVEDLSSATEFETAAGPADDDPIETVATVSTDKAGGSSDSEPRRGLFGR